jgi:hypothetical protein
VIPVRLRSHGVDFSRKLAEDELLQIDFLTRVVDVDPDQVARGIVVQHDAFGAFAALDARPLRKIDKAAPYAFAATSIALESCFVLQ